MTTAATPDDATTTFEATPDVERRSSPTEEQARATMEAILAAVADAPDDAVLTVDRWTYRGFFLVVGRDYGLLFRDAVRGGVIRTWLQPHGADSRLPREVEVVRDRALPQGSAWALVAPE